MMRFADPWWLALAPLAVALVWFRARRRARPAVIFSSLAALEGLPVTLAQRIKAALPALEVLGLFCLIAALARPQAGREDVSRTTMGIAIEMVIDRSGSMEATDLDDDPFDRRNLRRIDVVKSVVKDFADSGGDLPGRPNDLLGLVTFCGYVQSHCPLTFDHDAFLRILETVELPQVRRDARGHPDPRDVEVSATALGDGLVVGIERLKEIPAKSRVVILLSDGRGNIGLASPEAGVSAAQADGVKVYSIAIGASGGDLDEATLKDIAAKTGGRFFNARSGADVERIYGEIDALERSELTSFSTTRWDDRFEALLLAGLALLALHRALADTRFRTLP